MEPSCEIRSSLRCEWGTPDVNTSYSKPEIGVFKITTTLATVIGVRKPPMDVSHPDEHIHPTFREYGQPSGRVLIYIMPRSKGLMECKSMRIILDRMIESVINGSWSIIPQTFYGSMVSNCGV